MALKTGSACIYHLQRKEISHANQFILQASSSIQESTQIL